MGGRGSGANLGNGSGSNVTIINEQDVWSYRHRSGNEPFVDAINASAARIQQDFPDIMNDVQVVSASELGGADRISTLGYYSPSDQVVALNRNYTNIEKMNAVYDASVASGFHPGRGERSGTEAVALHELGHALTDHVGRKFGAANIDAAAEKIVKAVIGSFLILFHRNMIPGDKTGNQNL